MCKFCESFDFRMVGYRFDGDRGMVYFPSHAGNIPSGEWFKYCPVCGRALPEHEKNRSSDLPTQHLKEKKAMTILEVFEGVRRGLPFNLEVLSVKEDNTKYRLAVGYSGCTTTVELRKTTAPGTQEDYCWYTIAMAMSSIYLVTGDSERGRLWLDAMHNKNLITEKSY